MTVWNVLFQVPLIEPTLCVANVIGGDEQINAIGFARALLRDPLECAVKFPRFKASSTKDAEASGFAYCGDHGGTMTEGKDGNVYPLTFARRGVHGVPFLRCLPLPAR